MGGLSGLANSAWLAPGCGAAIGSGVPMSMGGGGCRQVQLCGGAVHSAGRQLQLKPGAWQGQRGHGPPLLAGQVLQGADDDTQQAHRQRSCIRPGAQHAQPSCGGGLRCWHVVVVGPGGQQCIQCDTTVTAPSPPSWAASSLWAARWPVCRATAAAFLNNRSASPPAQL